MNKFFFKFKKLYFLAIFDSFPQFLRQKKFFHKIQLFRVQLKGFWRHAKIQRNLMIQFQENTQTGVRR